MAATMTTRESPRPANANHTTVELLTRAYGMELETVANYLAASVNLDGVRAQEVARALGDDVGEELGHARRLAERLKQLDALVPGSVELELDQSSLRPSADTTDVEHVIRGVLAAEQAAIEIYLQVIDETDGLDWVTQDLAISILADEEAHRRLFEGFLREYDDGGRR